VDEPPKAKKIIGFSWAGRLLASLPIPIGFAIMFNKNKEWILFKLK
jgi:hypothetical protein